MASSLDLDVHETHGEAEIEAGLLHPWAEEMHRRGVTFNGKERDRLFLAKPGGGFVDLSDLSGADSGLDGRGLVAADFDRDGDLDLFAHHLQRGRHALLRNDAVAAPSSVTVELRDRGANREGVGAKVVVEAGGRRTAQVVARGSGFASCGPAELVFGLGDAEAARVTVRWPDGEVEAFGALPRGARARLVRGTGEPELLPTTPRRLVDPLPDGIDLATGDALPELVLVDAHGTRVTVAPAELAAERGLAVHFWASYCAPCVRGLGTLAEREDGRRVLAISVDAERDWPRAAALLERASGGALAAHFVSLAEDDNLERLDRVVDLSRLAIPTTLLVDADGRFEGLER